MAYLVINAGSSSLKLSLFKKNDFGPEAKKTTLRPRPLWQAHIDGQGKGAKLTVQKEKAPSEQSTIDALDKGAYLKRLILQASQYASPDKITAVGHRVVHGGTKYAASVVIDDRVVDDLKSLIDLDPEHEAVNIEGMEIARSALPLAKHVAVFDTAFHHNMPLASQVYPGPYHWFKDWGIRRFGFHGINHQFCSSRVLALMAESDQAKKPQKQNEGRIITCHLGSGGSLCASLAGRSLMTTMGYTPLEGLVMSTRSGSIDPGLVLSLVQKDKYSASELTRVLNKESGLKGISGQSGDMREIIEAFSGGDQRAQLAFDIYQQNLAAQVASLVPILGGLDALVFTGGIGEHSEIVRSDVCHKLSFLGIELDEEKNRSSEEERDVSSSSAKVKTYVIAAGEDLIIAGECADCKS